MSNTTKMNEENDILQADTATGERVEFTKEMRKDYTILSPDMLPVHFKLFRGKQCTCVEIAPINGNGVVLSRLPIAEIPVKEACLVFRR